jgi:hypothetical protein
LKFHSKPDMKIIHIPQEIITHSILPFFEPPQRELLIVFFFNIFSESSCTEFLKFIQKLNFEDHKLERFINEASFNEKKKSFMKILQDLLKKKFLQGSKFHVFFRNEFNEFARYNVSYSGETINGKNLFVQLIILDLLMNNYKTEQLNEFIFHILQIEKYFKYKKQVFSRNAGFIIQKSMEIQNNGVLIDRKFNIDKNILISDPRLFDILCDCKMFPFSFSMIGKQESMRIFMSVQGISWSKLYNVSKKSFISVWESDYLSKFENFIFKIMDDELKSKLIYLYLKHNVYSQESVDTVLYYSKNLKSFFEKEFLFKKSLNLKIGLKNFFKMLFLSDVSDKTKLSDKELLLIKMGFTDGISSERTHIPTMDYLEDEEIFPNEEELENSEDLEDDENNLSEEAYSDEEIEISRKRKRDEETMSSKKMK